MKSKEGQRKSQEAPEEARGDLGRAKGAPQSPKMCSKGGQDAPERAKMAPKETSGQPLCFQDGPR